MVQRSVLFLLGLVIAVGATLVLLINHGAKDEDHPQATDMEYQGESPSTIDFRHSGVEAQDGNAPSSRHQDTGRVGEDRISSISNVEAVEPAQPSGFHEIALSEPEKANLLQAASVFLNRSPSEVLAKAMESGRVEYVRADRDIDANEYVIQGWIYYEPIDGQVPVVLCLSQTKSIVDWMYCQEETQWQ